MSERREYFVEVKHLTQEDCAAVTRFLLEQVATEVETFQCDIPFAERRKWPADVLEAAERLAELGAKGRTCEDDYCDTGVQRKVDPEVWEAFAAFAAYAYDADAWGESRWPLVALSDEGYTLIARLTDAEARAIAAAHEVPVVLSSQVRAERRAERRRRSLIRRWFLRGGRRSGSRGG